MAPFWSCRRRRSDSKAPGLISYVQAVPHIVICQECKMAVARESAQQVTVRRRSIEDPFYTTDVQEFYCPTHRRAWDIKELKAGYLAPTAPTYYKHRVEVTEEGQPLFTVPLKELVAAKQETQRVIEGQHILQQSLNESEAEVRELQNDLRVMDAENGQLAQELWDLRNRRRRR